MELQKMDSASLRKSFLLVDGRSIMDWSAWISPSLLSMQPSLALLPPEHMELSSKLLRAGLTDTEIMDASWEKRLSATIEKTLRIWKLEQDRGLLLANMGHEIRTPMNSLLGMMHLALQSNKDPRVQVYLRRSEDSARSLLRILNNLLDFARLEDGRFDLEVKEFSLEEVAAHFQQLVFNRRLFDAGHIDIQLDAKLPTQVVGDSFRLGQVLLSLAGALVKHTHESDNRLQVIIKSCSKGHCDQIEFRLIHPSLQLDDAQQAELFQPFRRMDTSQTRLHGGSSLGLLVSQKLIALMGGQLDFQSSSEGTEFRFGLHLPVPNKTQTEDQVQALEGREILFVATPDEHHEWIEWLESKNVKVHRVDASQAISIAEQNPPDLMLIASLLPSDQGLNVVRRLRQDTRTLHLPILGLAPLVDTRARAHCILAGMDEFLALPLTEPRFLDSIRHWIGIGEIRAQKTDVREENSSVRIQVDHNGEEGVLLDAGFDVETAINRLGGDWGVYKRMLTGFCKDHGQAVQEIQNYFEQGLLKDAIRRSHSLKGLSAFLGADSISRLFREFEERAIDLNQMGAETLFRQMHSEISRILDAGEKYLRRSATVSIPIVMSSVDLGQLRDFLVNSDSQAVEIAQQFALQEKESNHSQSAQEISRLVSRYDFDAALTILDKLPSAG